MFIEEYVDYKTKMLTARGAETLLCPLYIVSSLLRVRLQQFVVNSEIEIRLTTNEF